MRKPVRKAVIPAAGFGTRFLPATKSQPKEMLPIVDKPTIQYIIEEAIASGIEEILIVTAAGFGTRFLPATKSQPKEMLPIVDKPTIQYIIEEAIASGIEEILIVTSSTKRSIEDHFDKSYELEDTLAKKGKTDMLEMVQNISNMAQIHYIRQKEAKGLGIRTCDFMCENLHWK